MKRNEIECEGTCWCCTY